MNSHSSDAPASNQASLLKQRNYRNYRIGLLMAVAGALLFSAKAVFIKLAYQFDIDPTSLLTLRMLICVPIYGYIAYHCTRALPLSQVGSATLSKVLFSGLMGYYLASYFDLSGLQYITANLERLILYTYPSIVLIITAVRYKRPLHFGEITCVLAAYAGIALVFGTDMRIYQSEQIDVASFSINSNLWGALLVFASALTFALYLISAERSMKQISSPLFTSLAMLASTTAISIHFLLTRNIDDLLGYPLELYLLAVAIAIFSTVMPSFLVAEGIKRINATRASIIGSVGPLSTMVLGFLFLDETITVWHIAGLAIVIISSMALSRFKPS